MTPFSTGYCTNVHAGATLEATKENHPPHYHVSLYPEPYMRYLASKGAGSSIESSVARYRVRGGDSLWEIAQRHGTSVARLKRANGMSTTQLKPGMMLEIPAR